MTALVIRKKVIWHDPYTVFLCLTHKLSILHIIHHFSVCKVAISLACLFFLFYDVVASKRNWKHYIVTHIMNSIYSAMPLCCRCSDWRITSVCTHYTATREVSRVFTWTRYTAITDMYHCLFVSTNILACLINIMPFPKPCTPSIDGRYSCDLLILSIDNSKIFTTS